MFYFIVNKSSGSGRGASVWAELQQILDGQEIPYQYFLTKRQHHATELASEISSMKDDDIRIVVLGGDGTINEVLNGITDFSRIRLGVIPVGSGNDFVTGANLEKDPVKALERILSGNGNKHFDLGEAILPDGTKRIFGISAGIGMDAIVCKKALTSPLKKVLNQIGLGKLTYVLLTLATLMDMERVPFHICMKKKDGSTMDREIPGVIFLAAMNVPIEGGGVPMAPHASCHDGFLTACSAFGFNRLNGLGALVKILTKRHEKKKGFLVEDFQELEIHSKKPMVIHTDGEYAGDHMQVTFRVLPKVLRML